MREIVSVGICTYNQSELCAGAVRGFLEHGPQEIKIFVWDNKPDQPVRHCLPQDDRVSVIEDPKNSGYIVPNNRMGLIVPSLFHVVANDDIVVSRGWFDSIIDCFSSPEIGIAGPRPQFGFLDDNFRGGAVPVGRQPDYIEGWFMVFHRGVIDRYGIFDEEHLSIATCEDSDACLRVRELGWKIKTTDMAVRHLGQATKRSLGETAWGDHNHAYCRQRWADYLKHREFPPHQVSVEGLSAEQAQFLRWKFPFSRFD